MTPIARALATAAAIIAGPAGAGQHHIWFDAPYSGGGIQPRQIIAVCEDDGGQPCSIDLVDANGRVVPMQGRSTPTRGIALYASTTSSRRQAIQFKHIPGTRVRFTFAAGPVRIQNLDLSRPRPGAGTLVGFSTDASGLATTGSWQTEGPNADALPSGFEWVGGGLTVDASAIDTFIEQHQWSATGTSNAIALPRPPMFGFARHYTIGLRIEGLGSPVQFIDGGAPSGPEPAPLGVSHAPLMPGTAAPVAATTAGGMASGRPGTSIRVNQGFPATASAPLLAPRWYQCVLGGYFYCPLQEAVGWYGQARDDASMAKPGDAPVDLMVETLVYGLPREVKIADANGTTRTYTIESAAVSGYSFTPPASQGDVVGLRGQYAITGAGADVAWQDAVNHDPKAPIPFLRRIEPRPDLGGASVAAAPLSRQTNAVAATGVLGFALGIRLVEKSTPGEPALVASGLIDTLGFCLVEPRLKDSALCKDPRQVLPPAAVCKAFGNVLVPLGYCKP